VTDLSAKAQQIRSVVFDIDGVFTDGRLYFSEQGETLKVFHVADGLGIKLLASQGISSAIITGRCSPVVAQRAHDLGIQQVLQGQENKQQALAQLVATLGLTYQQLACVGDDWPDIAMLRQAGLAIAVANAQPLVKKYAHYVTRQTGGRGAVREVCEMILAAQGKLTLAQQHYCID
jgi:3-deoxy-D-manno-octulosonate 8-phosphate phosphatase (KDO 8-P phosphatase)